MANSENPVYTLEQLAYTLIPEWRKQRKITNPLKQKLKIQSEIGELADEIIDNNLAKAKMELGDCFITACVYADIVESKIQVVQKHGLAFYGSDISEKLAHFGKFKTISPLHSIAKDLGTTLELCANLAYQKIVKREGQTIDGIFVKNPEYVRGND